MSKMPKFYIEWWRTGSSTNEPYCNYFSIPARSFKYFVRQFINTNKYIVHLEMVEPFRKVVFSTRRTGQV